jgi:hypothetical protein
MVARPAADQDQNEHYLTLLDDLIIREYRNLLDPEDTSIRLGEFLKMIELRHKLTPPGSDQREFWAQMDRIRSKVLGADKPPRKSTGSTTRKRRKKGA